MVCCVGCHAYVVWIAVIMLCYSGKQFWTELGVWQFSPAGAATGADGNIIYIKRERERASHCTRLWPAGGAESLVNKMRGKFTIWLLPSPLNKYLTFIFIIWSFFWYFPLFLWIPLYSLGFLCIPLDSLGFPCISLYFSVFPACIYIPFNVHVCSCMSLRISR